MNDFRKIETQDDLMNLFEKTSFFQYDDFEFKSIGIELPNGDGDQAISVEECDTMGNLQINDCNEFSGADALFVQTLVQLFAKGELVIPIDLND